MIGRYSHPAVTVLWSDEWTYAAWLEIERKVLARQRQFGTFSIPGALELHNRMAGMSVDASTVERIQQIEKTTKHDVAAFLVWLRTELPHGQFIHFGLTSSDLVDTTQGMRFKTLYDDMQLQIVHLSSCLLALEQNEAPLVGRTHGQPAEPTSLRARAMHWRANLSPAIRDLLFYTSQMRTAKLSGPVGTFAHNTPLLEEAVARDLGLMPQGTGASQVIPRSLLAGWASAVARLAAACNKIATDLRLMNLLGEVMWVKDSGQVGSSAMAHKNNPIVAEQIRGLATMAAGYASMLQPLDLWLERDISNSSVERVAVPDLWHLLFHTIAQTKGMLGTFVLDTWAVKESLEQNANDLWVHQTTLNSIVNGMDYDEARDFALGHDMESRDIVGSAAYFTRNYPKAEIDNERR